MKIYLASAAPGHEGNATKPQIKLVRRRLLSYHQIRINQMGARVIFDDITRGNRENQP